MGRRADGEQVAARQASQRHLLGGDVHAVLCDHCRHTREARRYAPKEGGVEHVSVDNIHLLTPDDVGCGEQGAPLHGIFQSGDVHAAACGAER